MKQSLIRSVALVIFVVVQASASLNSFAAATAKELAELGGPKYTPMGATRAGNAEGTIPEWVDKPPTPGPKVGGGWRDPIPVVNEKPLFTITAANYEKYKNKLLPGQIAMFKMYPETFRMHIYPTYRTGVFEPWVYEATKRQAEKVTLNPEQITKGTYGLDNTIPGGGIPFPFPKNGEEAWWSHFLAFFMVWDYGPALAVLMDSNGNRVDVVTINRDMRPWWIKAEDVEKYPSLKGKAICPLQEILMPPRSAGMLVSGCAAYKTTDVTAYIYVPGQRRVRRAPEFGLHDSPSFGSDGSRIGRDIYSSNVEGPNSHFDRKLVGLREAYVPYNSVQLTSDEATPDKLFLPKHINQDFIRYELHRVWEVEEVRKPGVRDVYKRKVFYSDEDTWNGLAFEVYDSNDRLWRVGEQFLIYNFDTKTMFPYGDRIIDLVNGRYSTFGNWYRQAAKIVKRSELVISVDSATPLVDIVDWTTPQGLRKMGMR